MGRVQRSRMSRGVGSGLVSPSAWVGGVGRRSGRYGRRATRASPLRVSVGERHMRSPWGSVGGVRGGGMGSDGVLVVFAWFRGILSNNGDFRIVGAGGNAIGLSDERASAQGGGDV